VDSLKQEIKAWEENRNEKSNSVDWRFTTADARIKLKNSIPQFKLDRLLVRECKIKNEECKIENKELKFF
jgi:hypothetical protein